MKVLCSLGTHYSRMQPHAPMKHDVSNRRKSDHNHKNNTCTFRSPPPCLSSFTMAIISHFSIKLFIYIVTLQLSTAYSLICKPFYGTGINPQHCKEALMPFLTRSYHACNGDSNHAVNKGERFSTNCDIVGILHHMPQSYIWKTCAIGIDIAEPPHGLGPHRNGLTTWYGLKYWIDELLKTCVDGRGHGGILEVDAFQYVVVNPTAECVRFTCLASPKALGMPLGHYLHSVEQGSHAPSTGAGGTPPGLHGHGARPRD